MEAQRPQLDKRRQAFAVGDVTQGLITAGGPYTIRRDQAIQHRPPIGVWTLLGELALGIVKADRLAMIINPEQHHAAPRVGEGDHRPGDMPSGIPFVLPWLSILQSAIHAGLEFQPFALPSVRHIDQGLHPACRVLEDLQAEVVGGSDGGGHGGHR